MRGRRDAHQGPSQRCDHVVVPGLWKSTGAESRVSACRCKASVRKTFSRQQDRQLIECGSHLEVVDIGSDDQEEALYNAIDGRYAIYALL